MLTCNEDTTQELSVSLGLEEGMYHDSGEVHAGDSIHDDEYPGIRQVVEAVVKTNCDLKKGEFISINSLSDTHFASEGSEFCTNTTSLKPSAMVRKK